MTQSVTAAATKSLKVGTGVCLVIQRDMTQTAKLVASIDQVLDERLLFGIGGGSDRCLYILTRECIFTRDAHSK